VPFGYASELGITEQQVHGRARSRNSFVSIFSLFPYARELAAMPEVSSDWPVEREFDQLAIAVMKFQQGGVG